jgi:dephospho-CoA kinase
VTGTFRLIGLTGGIGCGKSTVARLIAARGVPVMDADQLAREVSAPGGPALEEIAAAWPEVVETNGQLNRQKLGAVVFADPKARTRLEAIMHPRIAGLANERATTLAAAGHRLAFYEASLLVETGRYRELDALVVVDAPEDLRIARVAARDGSTPTEIRARISAQQPINEKRRVATYVIENDGDLDTLDAKVEVLLKAIRAAE